MSTLMSISDVRLYLGSELYWRSIGSELLNAVRCGVGAEVVHRSEILPPIWFCITCRSLGGGTPIPQLFRKNSEIPSPESAGAANGVRSQNQSKQQGRRCVGRRSVGSRVRKLNWFDYYVVYRETTLQRVRLYYSAVKNKKNGFDTVFLSITAE